MYYLTLLQTPATAQSSGIMNIIMIAIVIVIFYFFMIRPQAKQQKKLQEARSAMKNGDLIITSGGLYGTIKNIDTTKGQVTVEVAEGLKVRVDHNHVFPVEKTNEKK